MTPLETARGYAEALTLAGIRATVDPARAAAPCVLFVPPGTVPLDLNCGGTARMRAVVMAGGGPSNGDAWRLLDDFLGRVLATDIIPAEEVTYGYYDIDGTPSGPVYEIAWTEAVQW